MTSQKSKIKRITNTKSKKNLGRIRSKKIKTKKWNKTRKYRGGVDTPTGSPKQKRQKKSPTFKSVEDYNKRQEEIKEERSKRSVLHKVRDSMVDTVGSFLNPKLSRLDSSLAVEPYVAHGVVGSVEEKKRKNRHDVEEKAKAKVRSMSGNKFKRLFYGDDTEFVQGVQAMMVIPPELRQEVNAAEFLSINEVITEAEWDDLAKECYIFSVRLRFYQHWKESFLRNPDEDLDKIFHNASLEWKKYVKIKINDDDDDALLIFDRLFKHLIEKFERIIYKLFYRFRATLTPSDCFYAAVKIYQGMLKLNSWKLFMPGSNIILNTIKFFCDLTREIPSQIRCNRLEGQNLVYKYDMKEKFKNEIKIYRAFLFLEFYVGMNEDIEYEFDLESYHHNVVLNIKNIDEFIVKGGRPEIKPTRTSILDLDRNVDFEPELEDLFKAQEEREYKEPYIQITSENEKFVRSFMPNLEQAPVVVVP